LRLIYFNVTFIVKDFATTLPIPYGVENRVLLLCNNESWVTEFNVTEIICNPIVSIVIAGPIDLEIKLILTYVNVF